MFTTERDDFRLLANHKAELQFSEVASSEHPDVRSPSEVASDDFEKAQKNYCSTRSNNDFARSGDTLPDDSYVKTLKLEEKTKREEKLKIKAAAV